MTAMTIAELITIADNMNAYPFVTIALDDAITLFCNERNIARPNLNSKAETYTFINNLRPLIDSEIDNAEQRGLFTKLDALTVAASDAAAAVSRAHTNLPVLMWPSRYQAHQRATEELLAAIGALTLGQARAYGEYRRAMAALSG